MMQVDPSLRHVVLDKIQRVKRRLEINDGLPEITLSIGVAFSAEATEDKELFKIADEALYRTKNLGKNGYTFYSDIVEQ